MICSTLADISGVKDISYCGVDCFFVNEPEWKAYRKFYKHDGVQKNENSISFVITLDAIMTDCVMSFESTLINAYNFVDCNSLQFKEGIDIRMKTFGNRNGGSIPQKRTRRLEQLLPHAATKFLQCCLPK